MAITTSISKGYGTRLIIIAVVCTGFGIWGIYDYAVKIPRLQMLTDRLALLEQCKSALETEQAAWKPSPEAAASIAAVDAEIKRLFPEGVVAPGEDVTVAEYQQRLLDRAQALPTSDEGRWLALLASLRVALANERRIPLESYPDAFAAYQATDAAITPIADVTSPGKYDRITQWAFISCLPFGPYMLWVLVRTRRQVYRLDDDGTLHMREATWPREEIADIDMGRWMAKSIAWVVHRDGTRAKLDDYKHRNLHLIVGSIAHRLAPREWDAEARPITEEAPGESETAGQGTGAEAGQGNQVAEGHGGPSGGSPPSAPAEQPAPEATSSRSEGG